MSKKSICKYPPPCQFPAHWQGDYSPGEKFNVMRHIKVKVRNFTKFGNGWAATVKADTEYLAREGATNQLIGENTPEYISDDNMAIAINDVRYNVTAILISRDNAPKEYAVYIDPAE